MSFYGEMAEVVLSMLKEFGKPVTVVRETDGVFDPVTGSNTPGTTEHLKFNGVLKSYKQSLIDGSLIMQGDKLLVLDASHEPKKGDKVQSVDGNWQIEFVDSMNPAGVPLAYKVQVRR